MASTIVMNDAGAIASEINNGIATFFSCVGEKLGKLPYVDKSFQYVGASSDFKFLDKNLSTASSRKKCFHVDRSDISRVSVAFDSNIFGSVKLTLLESIGRKFGNLVLLEHSQDTSHSIKTIFHNQRNNDYYEIDLLLALYNDGSLDSFFEFSHTALDQKFDREGMFHSILLQAMVVLRTIEVNNTWHPAYIIYEYDVRNGLIVNVDIPNSSLKKGTCIKDVKNIQNILFNFDKHTLLDKRFYCFSGLVSMLKTFVRSEDRVTVIDNFTKRLFNNDNRRIHADSRKEYLAKIAALNHIMHECLLPNEITKLVNDNIVLIDRDANNT